MIAKLTGTLAVREASRIVLETAGVGYEVFIPLSTYYRLPDAGEKVALEIRHVVREDASTLYGFATATEKYAFDLLMEVQHVGPKLGLAILSVLAPDELAVAIAKQDVDRIDAVPGVGPKVAERVVRELRDKIGELKLSGVAPVHPNGASRGTGTTSSAPSGPADDAISALVNLGVKPIEARRAVEAAGAAGDSESLETLIRKSLGVLFGEK